MQSFLNKIAKTAIQEFSDQLGELTIVLPNRRSIVFLKEEFKNELKNSGWLPEFLSIEDFIQGLGNYQLADSMDLIFELYKIHLQIEGKEAESFHDFMSWGSTLLHDFNEIDRYLIDGKQLFSFLTEAKAIEVWDLQEGGLTEFQHNYLRFWKKLGDYYQLFHQRLQKTKKVYQGLGFRLVVDQINAKQLNTDNLNQLFFVGFNALTAAEKVILKYFRNEHEARIFWDADEYYMNDNFQEAGQFLRTYKKEYAGNFNWVSNHLLKDHKNISIHGISGNVGQAKLIGNLLKEKEQTSTAVVLSDEELLIPLLESLPTEIKKINVTMGYSLSLSTIYSWIESYLKLFQKTEKAKDSPSYYYKDVKHFLEHPVCQHFDTKRKKIIDRLLEKINREKPIFVIPDLLIQFDKEWNRSLFVDKNISVESIISNVLYLLNELELITTQTCSFDLITRECLIEFTATFNRLERLCNENNDIISLESLISLFKQIVSTQLISFVGEPLGGLQIMGVLESRVLDFENVIISSVNEGILPSGKTQNSFIPFDVKRKFGLPSYQEKDAIFAYHFYRLLQRATNISILYNTKVDQLQGGEKSRFVEQLMHEAQQKNTNINLQTHLISPKSKTKIFSETAIGKTKKTKEKILQHLKDGLSPSALNTFLACPLDYYYRYIIKLKQEDSFEEKIEDNTLGTIVHNSLENLYKPVLGTPLNIESLKNMESLVEFELNTQFQDLLNVKAEYGNHKLTYEVAKTFIQRLIDYDKSAVKKGANIIITGLEDKLSCFVNIKSDSEKQVPIHLYGKIDRVDLFNGQKRIIDYKTGGVQQADLYYSSLSTLLSGNKSKAVQLLIYEYMNSLASTKAIRTGIISLRNISQGLLTLKTKNTQEDVEFLLKNVVNHLLSEEAFVHNSRSKYCYFCNKKGL